MHKIQTGIYHKGSRYYSSKTNCVGSMLALVFVIIYFVIQIQSLTNVKSINIYPDRYGAIDQDLIVNLKNTSVPYDPHQAGQN